MRTKLRKSQRSNLRRLKFERNRQWRKTRRRWCKVPALVLGKERLYLADPWNGKPLTKKQLRRLPPRHAAVASNPQGMLLRGVCPASPRVTQPTAPR